MNPLTTTAIALGVFIAPCVIPVTAHAFPSACEHRGRDHVERHGGTVKDREYHLARGERVSCEPEDTEPHPSVTPTYVPVPVQDEEDEDDDDHHRWHRKNKWWRDD
ncbi:DUF7199 family protein [Mycobacteroides abscessus]|uniref:DUF7199 family protein n=1 Tax=Mycobacteroides abscessus TaxID=36809 RepID=UPI003F55413C